MRLPTGLAPRLGADAYEAPGQPQDDGTAARLLGFMADISVSLGSMSKRMDDTEKRNRELLNAVFPLEVPAQSGIVTAGSQVTIASAELLGPREGYCWDVRRITVTGLASSSEIVGIYRVESPTSASAVGYNLLTTVTGPTGVYNPGLGACWLRAGQTILVANIGNLTVGEVVVVNADAVAVQAKWVGAYLL